MTEFDRPPTDPVALFHSWFAAAKETAREPGVVALATADAKGMVSNRIVQTIKVTDTGGWIFTSHAGSQKGRDIAATGWASGVFYWRETSRQLIISGPVCRLSDADCDELWFARHPSTHPMSVAAAQSALLEDEEALRTRAQQLADSGQTLARPVEWLGYELVPSIVEFWQGSPDRLHRRLRYDRADDGSWSFCRLQP